jgi:hypothetical protein
MYSFICLYSNTLILVLILLSYLSLNICLILNYSSPRLILNHLGILRTKASFLPNFIHSLDASILKLIVLEVNKRHGLILEPLHDCFRYPLNYHDAVLEVIRFVYERGFSKPNFLERYVLD